MKCTSCNIGKITNQHFKLCLKCNNKRLYGNEFGKVYKYAKKEKASLRRAPIARKPKVKSRIDHSIIKGGGRGSGKTIATDEFFYELCFDSSKHRCEECNKQLPTEFRDENGKIIARWRYSHIVAKSIAPELRYNLLNINHLCMPCHTKWDHGDKKSMRIYAINQVRLAGFDKKYLN